MLNFNEPQSHVTFFKDNPGNRVLQVPYHKYFRTTTSTWLAVHGLDRGSNPWPGHPKDYEDGTHCLQKTATSVETLGFSSLAKPVLGWKWMNQCGRADCKMQQVKLNSQNLFSELEEFARLHFSQWSLFFCLWHTLHKTAWRSQLSLWLHLSFTVRIRRTRTSCENTCPLTHGYPERVGEVKCWYMIGMWWHFLL